jgi:uncharacterized protein (TIGR03083 family)
MPETTFADNMAVLREETERITAYLADLPAEAWTQPTACDAWQVQDVVAHLVGVAEFYAGNVTRGLQGDTEPPAGRPPAGSITAVRPKPVPQEATPHGGQHLSFGHGRGSHAMVY